MAEGAVWYGICLFSTWKYFPVGKYFHVENKCIFAVYFPCGNYFRMESKCPVHFAGKVKLMEKYLQVYNCFKDVHDYN